MDVVASAAGLIVLGPGLALVSLLVRATSPGPALFRQERVGRYDSRFEILKFRTMTHEVAGAGVTAGDDARVTPVGVFLRRTKIDELPQLVNVLKGEMSLVGPRPELPVFTRHWTKEQADIILTVRPGITDPASVHFRDESTLMTGQADPEAYYVRHILPTKAAMYVEYVQTRSTRQDLGLILRTVLPFGPLARGRHR